MSQAVHGKRVSERGANKARRPNRVNSLVKALAYGSAVLWLATIASPAPGQSSRAETAHGYFARGGGGLAKQQAKDYDHARHANLRSAEDYFKRGVTHYQRGALNEAIADFDRALELALRPSPTATDSFNESSGRVRVIEPGAAAIYYNRAVARYDQNDLDGALADLDTALKLNPRYTSAWIKRGNIYLTREAWDAAIIAYDRAIRLDEHNAIAWNNRGLAHQNKKDIERAYEDYNRALQINPLLPVALNNRAAIKHDRGDLKGALADYDQAVKHDGSLAFVFNNRGITRKKLGDLRGALADYTQAIRLRPAFALAYFNRSAAYKALGKGFEAEADFMRSVQLSNQTAGTAPPQLEPPLERVKADKP